MTTARPQQRYDHRLRELVRSTGDLTIATDLGIPRSTARGWLLTSPPAVVSLNVMDLSELELRQEVLTLRRRIQKLAALLRLSLVLLRVSDFTLSGERRPDGPDTLRILRAIDQACACIPLRALLRLLRLSPSRFHAWRRRHSVCALDDQSSCPRTSPRRLTPAEIRVIEDMVTSPEYRHVPTGTLAVLAQRRGTVWASASTWYRLVRRFGWRRPRLRVHPAKPKIGLRTTRPDEMWHIDTTVIRLLDGTRAYLHAVIDNFSRRIVAWRVAETFAPVNSVAVLLDARRGANRCDTSPVVLADAGVENVNALDELITTGVLRRVLAFHGAAVLQLHDRGVVAVSQTSVALPPLARQRHDRPSTRGVLRRRTQPRASAFGVSRTDAGRDVRRQGRCGPRGPDVRRGCRTPGPR